MGLPETPETPELNGLDGTALDTIVSVFERVAAAKSDTIAIVCGEVRWTYGQLNGRRIILPGRLREAWCSNGLLCRDLPGSFSRDDSGDIRYPEGGGRVPSHRLRLSEGQGAGDAGGCEAGGYFDDPELAPELSEKLSALSVSVVEMDGSAGEYFRGRSATCIDREDLAYLMYTSGSTGKPKGVMVTHRNVLRLLEQTEAWFHFGVNDVWTMFHSIAFDFSVWEIWGPLLTGGRLVIVPSP